MQRANETGRSKTYSIAAVTTTAAVLCTIFASPAAGLDPDVARDEAHLQPLWHAGPTVPSSPPVPAQRPELPLHHFDLPCATCHEPAERGNNLLPARAINRGCTSADCHNYDPMLNHPIGVAFPPGTRGQVRVEGTRITCITCHVPANGLSSTTDPGRPAGILLSPDGDLCASCHVQMNSPGSQQTHWLFLKAHLGNINPFADERAAEIPSGRIDDESMTCLNCHDDITVTIPGENETRQEQVARWSRMQDHPIGMDYRALASRQMAFFNYPLPATDHVRLFDDRVGCGSCHSVYAHNSSHTIAERGNLCRQCHIR